MLNVVVSTPYLLLLAALAPWSPTGPMTRTLAARHVPAAQRSGLAVPPPMTAEQAFFHDLAINGVPEDAVDKYAGVFDPDNYIRAMRDEFERNRYRAGIQSKITAGVASVNFETKFSSKVWGTLGEYSFTRHAFPILGIAGATEREIFRLRTDKIKDVAPLTLKFATNATDFDWFLAMPEAAASALVKANPRRVVGALIVYSVNRDKGSSSDYQVFFRSTIHSVTLLSYGNETSLGSLTKVP